MKIDMAYKIQLYGIEMEETQNIEKALSEILLSIYHDKKLDEFNIEPDVWGETFPEEDTDGE